MSKTPDDAKKGLECCNNIYSCPDCPYGNGDESWGCTVEKNADALALIQQLEKRVIHLEALNQSNLTTITMQERTRARLQEQISQLEAEKSEQAERIQQLEAERDALINDIRSEGGLCALCKHEGARAWAEPCCRCNALIISGESHWEWRGVQKEDSDA